MSSQAITQMPGTPGPRKKPGRKPTSRNKPLNPTSEYLDRALAARRLNVSVQFIDAARRAPVDGLPYYQLGRSVRFRVTELDAWAARRRNGGQP